MKYVQKLFYVLAFACGPISADELVTDNQETAQDIEVSYHKALDTLFVQAQKSLAAKENIITLDWLARKEMEDIKNLMSDIAIILSFNSQDQKEVAEKLQVHLGTKVRSEVEKVCERDEARVKDLRQFLYLSETICNVSHGVDCDRMMRVIKNENYAHRQNLKIRKKVRRQVNKEDMRQLCEIVALGAQPRR